MTDEPVDLNKHRAMSAQKSTEIRRRLQEVQADWQTARQQEDALQQRQTEFERYLLATPAVAWPEAAAAARYLLQLFAATPEAQDPRRQALIARTVEDLDRLSSCKKDLS
jgi:hypothetical protein